MTARPRPPARPLRRALRPWRIAGAMLGALAAFAAIEAGQRREAEAWFDPCPTCAAELVVCCPKPCPTLDLPRSAGEAAKLLLMSDQLAVQERTSVEWARWGQVLGAPGRRASVQSCPKGRGGLPAEAAPKRAAGEARERRGASEDTALARVVQERHRAAADADRLLASVATEMGRAGEREALASDAVQGARDLRDLVRRMAELETANAAHMAVAAAARAEAARLSAAGALLPEGLEEGAPRRLDASDLWAWPGSAPTPQDQGDSP